MATEAQKRRLFRDLNKVDHDFVDKVSPFIDAVYKYYFRVDIKGFENVPDQKALFVGNHNGLVSFEVLMMGHAWYQKYGRTRRALGLAHAVAIDNPVFSWMLPRLGAIPADPEIAYEALARDYSLLVYPGGEKEAFRPFTERKKVDFYQRKGFIRLALKAKVPIVPIISVGAHETYVIFDRGEELAKALGLYDRMRLHGAPFTLRSIFFMWCMVTGAFTFFPLLLAPAAFASIFIPLPAKMDFKILPAIDICSMADPALTDEQNQQKIYDHVVAVMQAAVLEGYEKRKYPFIG